MRAPGLVVDREMDGHALSALMGRQPQRQRPGSTNTRNAVQRRLHIAVARHRSRQQSGSDFDYNDMVMQLWLR
jgi:hypothetical protein